MIIVIHGLYQNDVIMADDNYARECSKQDQVETHLASFICQCSIQFCATCAHNCLTSADCHQKEDSKWQYSGLRACRNCNAGHIYLVTMTGDSIALLTEDSAIIIAVAVLYSDSHKPHTLSFLLIYISTTTSEFEAVEPCGGNDILRLRGTASSAGSCNPDWKQEKISYTG